MSSSGPSYHRGPVTWAAFGALFSFGLLNAALGPSLPFLRDELGLSYVTAGLHQAAFAVGGGLAGLLAVRGTRLDRRTTVATGTVAAGLAGLGIGYGGSVVVTLGGALLVSLFATSALISVWAALADLHRERRAVAMTEGEVSVSLAGVLMPALVAWCATTALGWSFMFAVGAAVAVLTALVVVRVGLPGAEPRSATPPGRGAGRSAATLVTIFAVVALEFSLSFWLASFLADDLGLSRDRAASTVSLLYVAHLVGRLVASRAARRVEPRGLLLVALLVVLAGSPVLLTADTAWQALAGIALTGAGTGATFPLASSLHVEASRRRADDALGQTLVVAACGQVVGPLAAGVLAQATDLRLGLVVLPACALLAAGSLAVRRA